MIGRIITRGQNSGLKLMFVYRLSPPPPSLTFHHYFFYPNREPVHRLILVKSCNVGLEIHMRVQKRNLAKTKKKGKRKLALAGYRRRTSPSQGMQLNNRATTHLTTTR